MMNKLGQAIIWKLKDHEDRILQNTEDISELQKIVKEQQKVINRLVEKLSPESSTIIMNNKALTCPKSWMGQGYFFLVY